MLKKVPEHLFLLPYQFFKNHFQHPSVVASERTDTVASVASTVQTDKEKFALPVFSLAKS